MIHPSEICNLFLYRTKEYSTLWKLALLEILAFNIGKILLIGIYCISTMKPSSMSGKPLICIDRVCEVFRLAGFWSAQSEIAPLSPMGLLASTLRNTWQNPWPLSVWITHQQFQVSLILGTEQWGNPFTELLGIVRGKSSILLQVTKPLLSSGCIKLYFGREMLGLAGQTRLLWVTATALVCKACPLSCHTELALGVLHIWCVTDCSERAPCPLINTSPASIIM